MEKVVKPVKDLVKVGQQVQTVIDYTEPQPVIKLECPECHTQPHYVGARFCSNCGTGLKWDNVLIRQPKATEPIQKDVDIKDQQS